MLANAAPNESLVWMLRLVRNTFTPKIKRYSYHIPSTIVGFFQGEIGWCNSKNEIGRIVRSNICIVVWQLFEAIVNAIRHALKCGVLLTRGGGDLAKNLSLPGGQALVYIGRVFLCSTTLTIVGQKNILGLKCTLALGFSFLHEKLIRDITHSGHSRQ